MGESFNSSYSLKSSWCFLQTLSQLCFVYLFNYYIVIDDEGETYTHTNFNVNLSHF